MLKMWLFILCLCTAAYSAPKCFNEYASAADKIESYYAKNHVKSYDFFPVNLFPFYFLSKDMQDTVTQYTPVYLCDYSTSIYLGKNRFKWPLIIITTVQYVKVFQGIPPDRIYTAFFFRRDPFSKEWLEDKKPINILFLWNIVKQQYVVKG